MAPCRYRRRAAIAAARSSSSPTVRTSRVALTVTATRDPGNGAYSVDLPTALGGGTYTAQAEQADSAGNVGTSSANTFVVESPYRPHR